MRFLFAAVVLLFPMFVSADEQRKVRQHWTEKMSESASHLKAQEYKRALKVTNRTIAEMVDRLGPGDASTELFGIVLTYKALAHAGLGETDEALWYWRIVLSLYPKVAENDMSTFGAAGDFLKQNLDPPPAPDMPDGDLEHPKLVKRVKPKYPHGAHYFGTAGELVVEVVVTPEGKVRSPSIQKALPAPTLSYAALEALRRWRFEPATVGGTPIAFLFNLTINYKAD